MKEQEAIKILETDNCWECRRGSDSAVNCEYSGCSVSAATKTAIQALEEIQQYRAIGTVQQCKEAVEKSQEIQLLPPRTSTFTYKGICPVCGEEILISEKYCSQCGQKVGVSNG